MEVGIRQLTARYARAEKIPLGGTMDARMDGVSLCLEKNVFVKPNVQSQVYLGYAMARKGA